MYKVSGENISPKEVEEVISRHPAVNQVHLVGVPDARTTQAGPAFVVLKEGVSCTRAEIVAWCQQCLAKFKVLRHLWFVLRSEWPMTGTGMIQKFRWQQMAEERLRHAVEAERAVTAEG
ncbi:MAG TPA: hypothetical protein VF171_00740 [Trueperaceae bacterium]